MSAVSSVGRGGTRGLSQFIQRLARQRTVADDAANAAAASTSSDQPDRTATVQTQQAHGDPSAMRSRIESAVSKALADYHGTGDVHQVIRNAIRAAISPPSSSHAARSSTSSKVNLEKILRSHGLSVEQFRKDAVAAFKRPPTSATPPAPQNGAPNNPSATGNSNTSGSSSSSKSLTTGSLVDVNG